MALNIFEPLKFSTQGINDLATQPSLVVSNGKITVDTVEPTKAISFTGGSFAEVEGKGIKWTGGNKSKTLTLRQSKIWTDTNINLAEELDYQINNVPVLSFSELGSTVTKSNLKTVGTLKSLKVAGSATIGDFAFISSELNRIGINTETPGAAIGIRENSVDIILGSSKTDTAVFGTTSNDHVEIITDNTARITVQNNGDVQIYGKLYVEEVVTSRSNPVAFKETPESTIYGKGIVWNGLQGNTRQLVYQSQPDRIWSTDHIDLADGKYFSINRVPTLTQTTLGDTVTESNLQKLGVLKELQVAGNAAVTRTLSTNRIEIGQFVIGESRLETTQDFNFLRDESVELTIGNNIVIGNTNNTARTVSVYGQLAVGVANPDQGVALTVDGPISFENKKFEVGTSAPHGGSYSKGDIIWNSDPKATDYIGWVCVVPGAPGAWLPFGAIASR